MDRTNLKEDYIMSHGPSWQEDIVVGHNDLKES